MVNDPYEPYGGWNYDQLAIHLAETQFPNVSWNSLSPDMQRPYIGLAQTAILWFITPDDEQKEP